MTASRFVPIEQTALVQVRHGPHDRTLLTLISWWASEVLRFQSELDWDWEDPERTVWNSHDLVGAYYLRNAIEIGLDTLETSMGNRKVALLAAIDELFITFTVEDADSLLRLAERNSDAELGWWWRRIPVRGPVPQELRHYSEARGIT